MNWDLICTKKAVAEETIRVSAENLKQIQSELRQGVTMGAAKAIIRGIWGETPEAKRLVSRLTVNFPKENASVIRYASLPQYAIANILGPTANSCDFFLDTQEYIERSVGVILAKIGQFDSDNEIALNTLNEFRKNVLVYIEGMRYQSFAYDVESLSETRKWSEYTVNSQAIEDGDYLMITDFIPDLKAAHDAVLKRRNKDWHYESDSTSLSGAVYDAEGCLAEVIVTHLFAEYLNELMAGIELVLE